MSTDRALPQRNGAGESGGGQLGEQPIPAIPQCPLPLTEYPRIVLAHGGGGTLSRSLLERLLLPAYGSTELALLHDGATLQRPAGRIAFTTDSYVIRPLFFPGGDIGSLAVNGTINDLAMCGAQPLAISVSFILEEGFHTDDLWRIAMSIRTAAAAAGAPIVTGDTKVVDRGKGDGIYINTAGIGVIEEHVQIAPTRARPGDVIIVSGPIANHGIAIMSLREGLEFETPIASDCAALHEIVGQVLQQAGEDVHVLRDPTRGGVASALNEIAQSARVGMLLDEAAMPVREEVRGACELLGLDPLYVANEGRFLAIVADTAAERVLARLHSHPLGQGAAIVGRVTAAHPGRVHQRSRIGGTRVVGMLAGDQLPRIC